MPDILGYCAKMGVVVPSTNTTMEPELYAMAPHGVTFHIARMYLAQTAIGSPEQAQAVVQAFQAALQVAVRDVLTMEPDHLLIGVSALSFMGGVTGHTRFKEALGQTTTVPITTAAEAAIAALQCYDAKRLGLLSPHPPMLDAHYVQFFRESGYEVVKLHRIDCPNTLAIAKVDESTIQTALHDLCGAGADAIVQVGTDLVMTRLADEAERWLGKPVIAVKAAMLWHALRTSGMVDQIRGVGSLLREH
jgi:maleate isomerase